MLWTLTIGRAIFITPIKANTSRYATYTLQITKPVGHGLAKSSEIGLQSLKMLNTSANNMARFSGRIKADSSNLDHHVGSMQNYGMLSLGLASAAGIGALCYYAFGWDLELRLYNFLPLRVLSSLWGKINSYELPLWMRPRLYDFFCRTYDCDMSEALESDYRSYRNLSEFFNRRLKPDSRPISKEPGVVSPADGLVLHFGPIKSGEIKDVKGLDYSVQTFLGLQNSDYENELLVDKKKNELYNCIIYLAPGDYHGFHSPADWLVSKRKHFPGRLLSVKPSLMKRKPQVLHINERVCYMGNWTHGFFSMTAVGATNVGSIKVSFDDDLRTNRRHLWRPNKYACFAHKFNEEIKLKAGQSFGEFNFGSTIVLIFEAPKNLNFSVKTDQKIKYGQLMAKLGLKEPTTQQ